LYRVVDRVGQTVDFLLTAKRDVAAARRFLERAIDLSGLPDKITIDKSGANTAALQSIQTDCGGHIELRRINYLNNIVEQDHRAIKRIVRPMMGFKSLWSAASILTRIEAKHVMRKEQFESADGQPTSDADSFYSLAC
jgi:transposase-like protein